MTRRGKALTAPAIHRGGDWLAALPASQPLRAWACWAASVPAPLLALTEDGRDIVLNDGWADEAAPLRALLASNPLALQPPAGVCDYTVTLGEPPLCRVLRLRRLHDAQGQPVGWSGLMEDDLAARLAELSHALRSPLHAIRGWTHLLGRGGTLSRPQTRAIEGIETALVALVERLDLLSADTRRTGMLREQASSADGRGLFGDRATH